MFRFKINLRRKPADGESRFQRVCWQGNGQMQNRRPLFATACSYSEIVALPEDQAAALLIWFSARSVIV